MDEVMPKKFKPLDLSKIKTYALADRSSKVSTADFAKTSQKGASFTDFLNGLPNILAGRDLRSVISATAAAASHKKMIILGMGAHVIKVGLNPVIIDLMNRGIITCVAMNGAGIIHDVELAMAGHTSEDVAAAIDDGSFGMAEDTAVFLGKALAESRQDSDGLGQAVGRAIQEKKLPFSEQSILAAGFRLGIPVTVHVAIGTDIIHMHPQFDAAQTGIATHRDFRLFSSVVATLQQGVYFNVGSAVILPEVFLKAVALARNLGHTLDHFTTVNLDFVTHYRPLTNVINRPTARGGKGINLVGHHEIMLPLIAAGVIEALGELPE
jgi:deoxyhypusine synthase